MEGQKPPPSRLMSEGTTLRPAGPSTSTLARIPGLPEDGDRKSFLIEGIPKTVADLLADCRSTTAEHRHEALMVLSQCEGLTRSDLHLAVSTLLSLTISTPHDDQQYAEALFGLLTKHLAAPEGLFFALQLLRIQSNGHLDTQYLLTLEESVRNNLAERHISEQPSRRDIIELKHILLKALELPTLREVAVVMVKKVLEDTSKESKALRQDFANNILAFLRLNPDCATIQLADGVIDVKRLATTVFTTGFAPAVRQASTTPPPPRAPDAPGEALNGPKSLPTSRNIRAGDVIRRLMNDDTNAIAMRLSPEELHTLRQVEGLAADEFRGVTQQLRTRAINDIWARTAILDIVRARHSEDVTAELRTAVLGALINEARKIGRLTNQLEKEVFAVSAEIPSLPFLSPPTDSSSGGTSVAVTPPPIPPPLPNHA